MKTVLRTLLWILILLSVLLAGTLVFLRSFTRHKQDYIMPDFTGMTFIEATQAAKALELRLEVIDSLYLPDLPKGAIFRQVPPQGQHIKKNRSVELTINSLRPRQVAMPSLVGFSLRQAKANLASCRLQLGRLIYVPDMATNNVLDQRIKGESIPPGTQLDVLTSVDLVLGMAPNERAYIPFLHGKNLEAARDIISDYSLNIGRITYDASVCTAADTLSARVYRQTPFYTATPQWPLGTAVNLELTITPELLVPQAPVSPADSTSLFYEFQPGQGTL